MAGTSWMSDSVAELIEKVQVEMDRGSGKDGSDPGLDEATDAAVMSSIIQRGSESSEKVDCLHPHAKGCWMLLVRALTDQSQGIIRTSEAKIEDGAARFEELMSDLLPMTAHLPEEPDPFSIASENFPSPINLLKVRPGDSNSIDDEVEKPERAAPLEFTPSNVEMFFSSLMLGDVVGKPDSKKLELLETHRTTTEELVVLIDLAIAVGDYKAYGKAMEILKDVNPSAHRAIECLTGLPTIMASATSGHGERGGFGVAEFLQGWMSSGKGDIVGGLSGYKYSEKNNWSEYTDGSKKGWGEWFLDKLAEWGPELARYTADSVKGAEERDHASAQAKIDKAMAANERRSRNESDPAEKERLDSIATQLEDLNILYEDGNMTPAQARGQVNIIMGLGNKDSGGGSGAAGSGPSSSSSGPSSPSSGPSSPSSGPSSSSSVSSDEGGALGGGSDGGSGSSSGSDGGGGSGSGIDIGDQGTGDPGGGGSGDVGVKAGWGSYYIEEPPPDWESQAGKISKDDPVLFPGLESWVLFVQDHPDLVPEKQGKTLLGKPVTDSELYKLEAFLSTVRISEEAQLALNAKKAPIDIDKFAGAFLPLPGSAETLEECGAVEPDPDQLGPAVVFGGWDPGVP